MVREKRMNPVQIFGILAIRELAYCLRYHSFGSLMHACCKEPPQVAPDRMVWLL
jgi:hypothetical protein